MIADILDKLTEGTVLEGPHWTEPVNYEEWTVVADSADPWNPCD